MDLIPTIREERNRFEQHTGIAPDTLYLGCNLHDDLCVLAQAFAVATIDRSGEPIPIKFDGMTVHREEDLPAFIGFGIEPPPST